MSALSALKKCKSWEEFKSLLGNLPSKGKGDCFEELVQNYLQLEPKYSTKLQDVWLLKEVPAKIKKRLNLPGSDEGIDLIAQTREGTFWAIQCKYRGDDSKSLTRRELSTFTDLAFTVCNGIDLALVCTTADRFSHKLTLYGDRIGFVTGEEWRKLDAAFFRRLRSRLAGRVTLPKRLSPRPHQKRAIKNAHKHFAEERNRRGKMIMPCGTGKSLTGYWIAE